MQRSPPDHRKATVGQAPPFARVAVPSTGIPTIIPAGQRQSEQQIHCAVVQHLRQRGVPGLVWWHTPNGGSRNEIEGAIFKAIGVRVGVADLIFGHDGRSMRSN
jgi:hypothetical protein